jgi:Carbohydrate-selective porin, OprB family/S-layer homology domain
MSNLLWKSLVVSPAVLGASLLVASTAIAAPSTTKPEEVVKTAEVSTTQPAPQILAQSKQTEVNVLDQVNRYSNEGKNGNNNSQGQVTSVSQFSDVQPTDWAFQALQSLVERYGCIAGYPSGNFKGSRALTRYEFAAGLNACLDRVNELIATATADLVTKEDLATLQRLQEEFGAELATLRGRVDALEARTAELEANQFSTTTKLQGEAIFALTDVFGDESGKDNNAVFQDRVRLSLNTSFTGRDKLTTRLTAGNATDFTLRDRNGFGTSEGRQTFNIAGGSKTNSVNIDRLTYEVPVGPAQLYVAAAGGKHSQYAAVNNPYFHDNTDGGNGALSTFASENPIYRIGGGAGAALSFPLGKGGGILKGSSVTVGYLANQAENPGARQGVFNGNYAALGQLNFSVGDRVALAATYVHGYHDGGALFGGDNKDVSVAGNTGSSLPLARTGLVGTAQANSIGGSASSNSYGLSAAFRPSDKLSVSGFVSYSDVNVQGANNDFEAWSYGAGIALPDFGKKGNVLGIFGGREPYSYRKGIAGADSGYHIEGFYKYRVSDNISITPGVIYLTNPGQNDQNKDAVIGTLRTTFTF